MRQLKEEKNKRLQARAIADGRSSWEEEQAHLIAEAECEEERQREVEEVCRAEGIAEEQYYARIEHVEHLENQSSNSDWSDETVYEHCDHSCTSLFSRNELC